MAREAQALSLAVFAREALVVARVALSLSWLVARKALSLS